MLFFLQAEGGIGERLVTGVQACALPISVAASESTASQLAGLPAMVEGGTAERLHLQMRAADRHLLQERGIAHRLVVAAPAAGPGA